MFWRCPVETSKHRVFQFLDISILPDNMLIAIASDQAWHLGVLSSRCHGIWALRSGGWLGVGNDPRYSKARCFDPFPFPSADPAQAEPIRAVAEELDAHRKARQAEHPALTRTAMYNMFEEIRAGAAPDRVSSRSRQVYEQGLVGILQELHERLDRAVAAAYGWEAGLAEDEILGRLVALNRARAGEEASGKVRWLRPEVQLPRFGKEAGAGRQVEAALVGAPTKGQRKPAFPTDEMAQTAVVMAALAEAPAAVGAANRWSSGLPPPLPRSCEWASRRALTGE